MSADRQCPRCGDLLPLEFDPNRRGRRRIWCSDSCRSLASAERKAADRAEMAVRVVEVPRATSAWPEWPPLDAPRSFQDATVDVDACVSLLEALTHRARHGGLDRRVRAAAYPFLQALLYGNAPAGSTPSSTTTPASPPTAEHVVDETLMRLFGPEKYWGLLGGSAT